VHRDNTANCFGIAMDQGSWACMSALLDVAAAAFTPDAIKAPGSSSNQYGPHITDLLPEHVLSRAFAVFPDLASRFLLTIKPVRAYPFVSDGCNKVELNGDVKIEGSSLRSPPKFWQELLYSKEGAKQKGQPIEALLVPLKGIVGPNSQLLASIVASCDVFAAQGSPPYVTFKSRIVESVGSSVVTINDQFKPSGSTRMQSTKD
jgi:hypothetical protein